MSKRKNKPGGQRDQATPDEGLPNRNVRETIESIAIAFILAFLFRTFEAEAFVIPTGSMAHTLRGRHKDVFCVKCGHRYQASASEEQDKGIDQLRAKLRRVEAKLAVEERLADRHKYTQQRNRLRRAIHGKDVVATICPVCRYAMTVDPRPEPEDLDFWPKAEVEYGKNRSSYPGDRILVTKFSYQFGDPQRWDVVVFKYPGDAKMNYIKRLVGLPGEQLRIRHGDILTRPIDLDDDFAIARKPPGKIREMAQLVHDNNFYPAPLAQAGWPRRWQVWDRQHSGPGGWISEETEEKTSWIMDGHPVSNVPQVFAIDGSDAEQDRWIRYQHFVPTLGDWSDILTAAEDEEPLPEDAGEPSGPEPMLITDFYAYNSSQTRYPDRNSRGELSAKLLGLHWVGDLMVQADVEVQSDTGELILDLVEGGRHFECRIDVGTGMATFGCDALPEFAPSAQSPITAPGRYTITFANVDDRLALWVDGGWEREVLVEDYALPSPDQPVSTQENAGDLAPVGVGSRGAQLKVTRLQVYRDIYYIADTVARGRPITDYSAEGYQQIAGIDRAGAPHDLEPEFLAEFLASPDRWDVFRTRVAKDFALERFADRPHKDQFFMLGDNSPFSKDSRLWSGEQLPGGEVLDQHYVKRELLTGKALCIYWPHSWHRIPGTYIPFPFFPNFGDMSFVR